MPLWRKGKHATGWGDRGAAHSGPVVHRAPDGSGDGAPDERSASNRHRPRLRSLVRAVFATAAAGTPLGCQEPEVATIVAVGGCGLEGETLDQFRVRTRGDFGARSATQVLVSEGNALVGRDLDSVAAITIEGLFGDAPTGIGRTARMRQTGELPIYFARVDWLCPVPADDEVRFRSPGAVVVGELGDIVLLGGRERTGELTDEIVSMNDERGRPRVQPSTLPVASTGFTAHPVGPRSFVVVGGAVSASRALDSVVLVDVSDDGQVDVAEPFAIDVPLQPEPGRAYHASVPLPNDTILVAGGCVELDSSGACIPSATTVLSSAFVMDADGSRPRFARAPALLSPRYEHALHVARDGAVFAVGGRSELAEPVLNVDRLLPDGAFWEPYGPPLTSELPDGSRIDGSALLEGGMIVLAMDDGSIRWVNGEQTGVFPQWCDAEDTTSRCFAQPGVELPVVAPRPLLVLPGERILADHFLLPVAGVGQTGLDAVNLSVEEDAAPGDDNAPPAPPPGTAPPPAQRRGATPVVLADGTVLMAGGQESPFEPPELPLMLRLRPALDGPDEGIPVLSTIGKGSLIAMQPDRVTLEGGTVRMISAATEEFPWVRARVRGFRSRSFRFDATLSASGATPHIVLEQGAVAGLSVRFGPSAVRGFFRDSTGSVVEFSCGTLPSDFWDTPQVLEVTVGPDSFVVSQAGATLAQCPSPVLDLPVSIAIGSSGSGSVTASALRLTRL